MADPTYAELLSVPTPAAYLEGIILPGLEGRGLAARGSQPTRIARALAEIEADTSSSGAELTAKILAGGTLDSAEGPWLDVLAWGFFRELRTQPRQAIVQLRLTDTANAGPYRIQRPIVTLGPAGELYYRAQAGTIDVPRGGGVDAPFVAERTGSNYNLPAGIFAKLATPVPGLSVTSPAIPGQGTILIQDGTDKEPDATLRARCADKWGLLAQGYTAAKIRAIARAVDATLTRFVVKDPGGIPGIADLYAATAAGPCSYSQALAVYTALKDPARKPVGGYPVRVYPSTLLTLTPAITLYSDGTNPNVQTEAAARLAGYQSVLDLGTVIHRSRLVDVLVEPEAGCIGAVVHGLGGEIVTPTATDAVVFSPSSWTVVQG